MDYIFTFEDGSEAIAHYGILGMKWGVRKDRDDDDPSKPLKTWSGYEDYVASQGPKGKAKRAFAQAKDTAGMIGRITANLADAAITVDSQQYMRYSDIGYDATKHLL